MDIIYLLCYKCGSLHLLHEVCNIPWMCRTQKRKLEGVLTGTHVTGHQLNTTGCAGPHVKLSRGFLEMVNSTPMRPASHEMSVKCLILLLK